MRSALSHAREPRPGGGGEVARPTISVKSFERNSDVLGCIFAYLSGFLGSLGDSKMRERRWWEAPMAIWAARGGQRGYPTLHFASPGAQGWVKPHHSSILQLLAHW